MAAWFLIVMFTVTDDAKVAVFNTEKECEISKKVTESVIGKRSEVKSIECVRGLLNKE